jgi:hypothetical protein
MNARVISRGDKNKYMKKNSIITRLSIIRSLNGNGSFVLTNLRLGSGRNFGREVIYGRIF